MPHPWSGALRLGGGGSIRRRLEVVLTAVDLVCWTKKVCFADVPALARCEIATFRYRVLHVAARITRGARQVRLRIDKTWRWAVQIAEGFTRLRTAFG